MRPKGYKPPPHHLAPPPQQQQPPHPQQHQQQMSAFGGGGRHPQKPSEAPRSQVSKPILPPQPPSPQQQQQQQQAPPPHPLQKKPQVKMIMKRQERPNLAPPPPQLSGKPSKLPPGPMTGPMPGKKPSHAPPAGPPGGPDALPGRSRLKDRQAAKLKRGSGFTSSSSSSSSSRSRSRSGSRSSSASSASSASSSGSGSSSGSADSDDLYRDMGGKHDRRRQRGGLQQPPLPPSPLKSHRERREHRDKVPMSPGGGRNRNRSPAVSKPRDDMRARNAPLPPPSDPRKHRHESRDRVNKSTSQPAAFREVRESKDPMKLSGQKSIKLTLVNKNERDRSKGMPRGEKRLLSGHEDAPSAKRLHAQRSPAKSDMRMRADPRSPKAPLPPAPPSKASPKKRSATNRREELLKQLKAVENAIAKKRHK